MNLGNVSERERVKRIRIKTESDRIHSESDVETSKTVKTFEVPKYSNGDSQLPNYSEKEDDNYFGFLSPNIATGVEAELDEIRTPQDKLGSNRHKRRQKDILDPSSIKRIDGGSMISHRSKTLNAEKVNSEESLVTNLEQSGSFIKESVNKPSIPKGRSNKAGGNVGGINKKRLRHKSGQDSLTKLSSANKRSFDSQNAVKLQKVNGIRKPTKIIVGQGSPFDEKAKQTSHSTNSSRGNDFLTMSKVATKRERRYGRGSTSSTNLRYRELNILENSKTSKSTYVEDYRKPLATRKSPRLKKKEPEIIEIDSSEDEIENVEEIYTPIKKHPNVDDENKIVSEPKRIFGNALSIPLNRIVIGEQVICKCCELKIMNGGPSPNIKICFSGGNKTNSDEYKIDLKTDIRVKYYLAQMEQNDSDSEDIISMTQTKESNRRHESDQRKNEDTSIYEMISFIALQVKPTSANKLTKYPCLQSSKDYNDPAHDDPTKSSIILELRSNEDLEKLISNKNEFFNFHKHFDDDTKLEKENAQNYINIIAKENEKEKEQRLLSTRRITRSASASASKSKSDETDGKKILLVYPFSHDENDNYKINATIKHLKEVNALCSNSDDEVEICDQDKNVSQTRNHYLTIYTEDVERLSPGEYLNDTLIDFWMQWIWRTEDPNNTKVHFFTSHFFTKLKTQGVDAVSTWTAKKNIRIFDKTLIFIPINQSLHWSLCVVVNPAHIQQKKADDEKMPCILFMDSLKAHQKARIAKYIRKWLNHEWATLYDDDEWKGPFLTGNMKVYAPRIPYQTNGWDCGVFVCCYAYALYQQRMTAITYFDGHDFFKRAITDSKYFSFGMKNIASWRREMKKLFGILEEQYLLKQKGNSGKEKIEKNEQKKNEDSSSLDKGFNGITMENLATIVVADSKFLGFVKAIQTISDAIAFQKALKNSHSDAAHCPLGWIMLDDSKLETDSKEGFDEDGEPPNSVGPSIVNELKEWKKRQSLVSTSPQFFCEGGLAIVVVRYFGHRLLGVTCGRLSQCYESACKILLHRFTHGDGVPLVQEYKNHDTADKSIYGLCAGDTELIFNVVPSASHDERNTDDLNKIIEELQFGAFKGSLKESLPRLQNLQADIFNDIIPIYRYPGNYNGDEWQTFEWSPTSLDLRNIVETALLPLTKQSMNHCVTNYYRDGKDFIAHHSDKDLDLNKDGVIVSLSLGEERVMEFRKRDKPNDVTRILLPHGSMLVMGPNTNKYFTHSILQKPDSAYPRLSLTFRNVTTFMDENSGFCYGEGVELKSKVDVQKTRRKEDTMFLLGFCSLSTLFCSKKKEFAFHTLNNLSFAGIFFASSFMYRYVRKRMRKRYEEKLARIFFSKTSLSGTKY